MSVVGCLLAPPRLSGLPLARSVLISGCVQIWATMNNCAGLSRDVMLSQDALEAIVNKTLEQLRNPGLQCLSMVTTELMRITEECTPAEISRCSPLLKPLRFSRPGTPVLLRATAPGSF